MILVCRRSGKCPCHLYCCFPRRTGAPVGTPAGRPSGVESEEWVALSFVKLLYSVNPLETHEPAALQTTPACPSAPRENSRGVCWLSPDPEFLWDAWPSVHFALVVHVHTASWPLEFKSRAKQRQEGLNSAEDGPRPQDHWLAWGRAGCCSALWVPKGSP